jgi:hypothetical protein
VASTAHSAVELEQARRPRVGAVLHFVGTRPPLSRREPSRRILRPMDVRACIAGVALLASLSACTSSSATSLAGSPPPTAVPSPVDRPDSTPTKAVPVTVVNDTAVPVRVLCDVCGPSGFVLRSRGKRSLFTHVGDTLTYRRPGRTSCLLFAATTAGFNNLAAKTFLAKVSEGGNCPTA